MCENMVDIQSPTAEIRREIKKIERRNHRAKMLCPHLLRRAAITSRSAAESVRLVATYVRSTYVYSGDACGAAGSLEP